MGNQWLTHIFKIEHHVIFHSTDVKNLRKCHLTVFAINFEEKRRRGVISAIPAFPRGIMLHRFLNSCHELIIADGLEKEIKSFYLITLESIFLECRREDDTCR